MRSIGRLFVWLISVALAIPWVGITGSSSAPAVRSVQAAVLPAGAPGAIQMQQMLSSASCPRSWRGSIGAPGMDDAVRDLAVGPLGELYAGGGFKAAGGALAPLVARWDGNSWLELGGGTDGPVYALAVGGKGWLYAGGDFRFAGKVDASRVALWDGEEWSALGEGLDGTVRAMAVDGNGTVYAGGHFVKAENQTVNYIAKWDGSRWSALGGGTDGAVLALAIEGSTLYAGGFFTKAADVQVNYVARWDGQRWSTLGSGVNNHVYALAAAGGRLYAGGAFTSPASYVARWDGSVWMPLGAGVDGAVAALAPSGNGVYAAGYFTTAGGGANRIAWWNGSAWSPLGSGMDGVVEALALDSAGTLTAGGYFHQAGGWPAAHIAQWASACPAYLPLAPRGYRVIPPAPPSDLRAAPVSASAIQLDWTDNSTTEDEFVIEISPDGVHFTIDGTTGGPNITSVWSVDLPGGTRRCYRVYARNAQSDSNPSNTACATTQSNGPPAPLTNLKAQVISSTRILLTWTNNSSCTGYNVFESMDGAPFDPNHPTGTVTPGNLPGAYVDVPAGHAYTYRVAPFNSFGQSPYASAPLSNNVSTPPSTSTTITKFFDRAVYPIISLQIDGVEQFPSEPQGIPPGGYYQKELLAGRHTYRAVSGFWNGGARFEMYTYQGSFDQRSGAEGQVNLNDPTMAQILTRFGASGYYVGEYWTDTFPHSAAFRFRSDGTYIFYRDGVAQGSGSYSRVTYLGNYLVTFQVTGNQNAPGYMDELTGSFYMRNGPRDWPTIQYSYDGP